MHQAQISTATAKGRHHHELKVIAKRLAASKPKILSFGCSTGQEVETLASIFQGAQLFGCDVNEAALATAAKSAVSATFFRSTRTDLLRYGPFDLITCCNVLCRHPAPILDGMPVGLDFGLWCELLGDIDRALKPGGILLLINSQYPFRFYENAREFRCINDPYFNPSNFVNLHIPVGLDCVGVSTSSRHWFYALGGFPIHASVREPTNLLPSDLDEICFQKRGGSCDFVRFSCDIEVDESMALMRLATRGQPDVGFFVEECQRGLSQAEVGLRAPTYVVADLECFVFPNNVAFRRKLVRTWFDGSTFAVSTATFAKGVADCRTYLEMAKIAGPFS